MDRMRDQVRGADPLSALTAPETKILELIGKGLTNRQIGERLFLAEKTVKNYVSSIFVKLGMERRTQAAAYAVRVFEGEPTAEPARPDHRPGQQRHPPFELGSAAVGRGVSPAFRRRVPPPGWRG